MGRRVEVFVREDTDRLIDCFAIRCKPMEGGLYKVECNAVQHDHFRKAYEEGKCGTPLCKFWKTKEQHRIDVIKAHDAMMKRDEI